MKKRAGMGVPLPEVELAGCDGGGALYWLSRLFLSGPGLLLMGLALSGQAMALEYGPWVHADSQCDSRVAFSVAHESPVCYSDCDYDSTYSSGSSSWALRIRNGTQEDIDVCYRLLDIPASASDAPNRCLTVEANQTHTPVVASNRLESGPRETILVRYRGFCEGGDATVAESRVASAEVEDYSSPSPSEPTEVLPPRSEEETQDPCAQEPISFGPLGLVEGAYVSSPDEPFEVQLSEGITEGTAIAQANAYDPNFCGIHYSLSEHTSSSLFDLTPDGSLSLKNQPQWAYFSEGSGFVRFNPLFAIIADNGSTRTVRTIQVKLEGDPRIKAKDGSFSIDAGSINTALGVGIKVGKIKVYYLDVDEVTATLSGEGADLFHIDESGQIVVDSDEAKNHGGEEFNLTARFESGQVSDTSMVNIRVQPNNAPTLSGKEISEPLHQVATNGRVIVRMSAGDTDTPSSSLVYALGDGASDLVKALFEVDAHDAVVVRDAEQLNSQGAREYQIPVTVSDGIDSDLAVLLVRLTENNPPHFSTSRIELATYPGGEARNLGYFAAEDQDDDEISYRLLDQDDVDLFEYSEGLKILSTRGGMELGNYQVVLEASDGVDASRLIVQISVTGFEPPELRGSTDFFIDATQITRGKLWGEVMAIDPNGLPLNHELGHTRWTTLHDPGVFRLSEMEPGEYREFVEHENGTTDNRRITWSQDGMESFVLTSSNGYSEMQTRYTLWPAMPWGDETSYSGEIRREFHRMTWGGGSEGPGFKVADVLLPPRLDCEQHIDEHYDVEGYAWRDSMIDQCQRNTGKVESAMQAFIDPDYGEGWRFQLSGGGNGADTHRYAYQLHSRGEALVEEGESYPVRVWVTDPLKKYAPVPENATEEEMRDIRMISVSGSVFIDNLYFPRELERAGAPEMDFPAEGAAYADEGVGLQVSQIKERQLSSTGVEPTPPYYVEFQLDAVPEMSDPVTLFVLIDEGQAGVALPTSVFDPGFHYYWRARSVDQEFVGSEWTAVRSFAVLDESEGVDNEQDSPAGPSNGGGSSGGGGGGGSMPLTLLLLLAVSVSLRRLLWRPRTAVNA